MPTCKTKTEQHLKWIPWSPLWNHRWLFMRENSPKKLEIFCKDANTVVISMTYLLSSVKNTARLFGAANCKLQFSSYLPIIRTLLGPSQSNSGLLRILTHTDSKRLVLYLKGRRFSMSGLEEYLNDTLWMLELLHEYNSWHTLSLLLYFEPCPKHILCIVSISYNPMR